MLTRETKTWSRAFYGYEIVKMFVAAKIDRHQSLEHALRPNAGISKTPHCSFRLSLKRKLVGQKHADQYADSCQRDSTGHELLPNVHSIVAARAAVWSSRARGTPKCQDLKYDWISIVLILLTRETTDRKFKH